MYIYNIRGLRHRSTRITLGFLGTFVFSLCLPHLSVFTLTLFLKRTRTTETTTSFPSVRFLTHVGEFQLFPFPFSRGIPKVFLLSRRLWN